MTERHLTLTSFFLFTRLDYFVRANYILIICLRVCKPYPLLFKFYTNYLIILEFLNKKISTMIINIKTSLIYVTFQTQWEDKYSNFIQCYLLSKY